jgi:Protein of unknown function (DUF3987)
VRQLNTDGRGGDGLMQRFGLMVWPDINPSWENVDQYPDKEARDRVFAVFKRLSGLDEQNALQLGATRGSYEKAPTLSLDDKARGEFLDWRKDLEERLRSGDLSPAMEGHLSKYRKLVPALAVLNHLADDGRNPVVQTAMLKALAFAQYLESHARRVYAASTEVERVAANAILARIRAHDLEDGFTARDVHQRDWSKLTDRGHVQAGLDLLVDRHHLRAGDQRSGVQGGRPKVIYRINPKVLR